MVRGPARQSETERSRVRTLPGARSFLLLISFLTCLHPKKYGDQTLGGESLLSLMKVKNEYSPLLPGLVT